MLAGAATSQFSQIDPAFALEQRRGRRPHGGRGALLLGLEALVDVALGVDPPHRDLLFGGQVALERGHDPARVDRERAHAVRLAQLVELQREQRVGALGLAVGEPLVVVAPLEIADRRGRARSAGGRSTTARPPARLLRRPFSSGHSRAVSWKWPEVVGRELAFVAARVAGQRARHDRGVVDQDVDADPTARRRLARTRRSRPGRPGRAAGS